MAVIEYSTLDDNGKNRVHFGAFEFDVSSDQTDKYFLFVPVPITIKRFGAACSVAWATGTSVTFSLGTAASSGAFAAVTVLLADMAAIGNSKSATTITDATVDANTLLVIDSVKSGSMTGKAVPFLEYEFTV